MWGELAAKAKVEAEKAGRTVCLVLLGDDVEMTPVNWPELILGDA